MSAELKAPWIELHTGAYANAYFGAGRAAEFARLRLVFAGKFQHGIRELAAADGVVRGAGLQGVQDRAGVSRGLQHAAHVGDRRVETRRSSVHQRHGEHDIGVVGAVDPARRRRTSGLA